ncbi:MAG TPA: GAF domain-containing protein [Gemmatimonadales bacterium]|nr:GAF domain-containing protein [Gemmatimonadales bacterium]
MSSPHEAQAAELAAIAAGAGTRAARAERAAAWIAQVGGYRWVGLYHVGPTAIEVLGWAGPDAPTFPRFPRTAGLNGAAVAAGEPVIVQDVSRDARYLRTLGSTRAEMIMPIALRPGGPVVGTIDVESERANAFSTRDLHLLGACAAALVPLWDGAV